MTLEEAGVTIEVGDEILGVCLSRGNPVSGPLGVIGRAYAPWIRAFWSPGRGPPGRPRAVCEEHRGGSLPRAAQALHGFPALVKALQRADGGGLEWVMCRSVDGEPSGSAERDAVLDLTYARSDAHRLQGGAWACPLGLSPEGDCTVVRGGVEPTPRCKLDRTPLPTEDSKTASLGHPGESTQSGCLDRARQSIPVRYYRTDVLLCQGDITQISQVGLSRIHSVTGSAALQTSYPQSA